MQIDDRRTEPSTRRAARARVLAGAVIGIIGGFTTLYFTTLSQFVQPVTAEFGWGRAQLSALTSLGLIGSALAAPVAGRLAQRHGSRPVIATSAVLLAAGLLAIAAAPPNPAYVGLVALLVGMLAVATTPSGYLIVVPRFFDRRLGLALGVAAAGGGVGAAAVQLATGAAIAELGWRGAYQALAVGALLLSAVAIAVGFPEGTGPQASAHRQRAAAPLPGLTVGEALRSPRILVMLAALFIVACATLGLAVHIVAFMVDRGNSPVVASSVAASGAIGVTLGRIISGLLLDHVRAPVVGGGVFLVTAIGFLTPALSSTAAPWVYAVSAMIGGFTIGTETDLIPFLVRRYIGPRVYPVMLGVTFGVYTLGGALGPVLFGLSYDRLGSYVPALWAGAAAFVTAAMGLQVLGRAPYGSAAADVAPPLALAADPAAT